MQEIYERANSEHTRLHAAMQYMQTEEGRRRLKESIVQSLDKLLDLEPLDDTSLELSLTDYPSADFPLPLGPDDTFLGSLEDDDTSFGDNGELDQL